MFILGITLIIISVIISIIQVITKSTLLQLIASIFWCCTGIAFIAKDTKSPEGADFVTTIWYIVFLLHLLSIHVAFKMLTAKKTNDENSNSN